MSSLAPSRAGRSPYNSEPSIEAPDSTTTSRRIFAETPAITHHPHHQATPGRAPGPASEATGVATASALPWGWRSASGRCERVRRGRCYPLRPWSPTQVTGRNPGQVRFRSRFSPADAHFSRSRGSRAARHLNRSLAFRRHLRSRSVKTCNYGRFTRIRHGAKPE